MAEQCQTCTELRARLAIMAGQVRAEAVLIRVELDEPTRPWRKTLDRAQDRLHMVADGMGS